MGGGDQLPQLHRPGAFPTPVILPAAHAGQRGDQTVAHQHPIHHRPRGQRIYPEPAQFVDQPARTPPGMGSVQLAHPSLDLPGQLPRVVMRAV